MLTLIHFAPSTLLTVLLSFLFYTVNVCSKLFAYSPSLIAFDELFSCDCSSKHNFWRLHDTPNIRAKSKLKPNKINEKKESIHLHQIYVIYSCCFRSDRWSIIRMFTCVVSDQMMCGRQQHQWMITNATQNSMFCMILTIMFYVHGSRTKKHAARSNGTSFCVWESPHLKYSIFFIYLCVFL